MNGRSRWFRSDDWPIWTFDTSASEWRRLERAIDACDLHLTSVAVAAQIVADRAGIELREAWDRLAFDLECMQAGIWPPQHAGPMSLIPTPSMTKEKCA